MAVSSEVRLIAGQKFFIGTTMTPADNLTNSSFTSMTWTQVNGWSNMGEMGDVRAESDINLIDSTRTVTALGTKSGGKPPLTFARKNGDAGQAAMIAARDAGVNYAFKIEGNEAGATTVSQQLFVGVVSKGTRVRGDANSVDTLSFAIAINSNTVEVAAA